MDRDIHLIQNKAFHPILDTAFHLNFYLFLYASTRYFTCELCSAMLAAV
jgi:hypothetical protein